MKAKKKKIDKLQADELNVDLNVRFATMKRSRTLRTKSSSLVPLIIFSTTLLSIPQAKNKVLEVFEPPSRKEGIIVDDVSQLIDKLKNEAGLLQ